jgi:uncharacterized RDD family membrane protein YckC
MDRDQLHISGLTGVDITLDIAGAGSRSFAFIIDWHIRLLLAAAWFALATQIYLHAAHGARGAAFGRVVAIPAICIYFFYHPVLEVLSRGRTPGKRMAGVRIVTRQGGTPTVGALLIRNVFRLVDAAPVFYLVGLLCCLFSAQRVRVGDMAAGTLLVREEAASARSLGALGALVSQSSLPPTAVELIDDLLQRWHSLDLSARTALARTILARVGGSAGDDVSAMPDQELRQRLQALLPSVTQPAS